MSKDRFDDILHSYKRNPVFILAIGLLTMGVLQPRPMQAQTYSVLYSFTGGSDGKWPYSSVIEDGAGNLYGTASAGGVSCFNPDGCGTVFKLASNGTFMVLHSFTDDSDGGGPLAGVIRDAAGNLYGTTNYGPGPSGVGTVFKLNTASKETVLHAFTGMPDGASPTAPLVRDGAGNLYGTAQAGGTGNDGVVFEWNAVSGKETILHSFTGGADGANPGAGLLLDQAGRALYGETIQGGKSQCSDQFDSGCGTAFKLTANGMEDYDFPGTGQQGEEPLGGLIRDAQGNFYGTTYYGGSGGHGSVFKINAAGTESVLYNFTGQADGAYPSGGLVLDPQGNLYGTTSQRGGSSCNGGGGCGTLFEITSGGKFTVVHTFMGEPSDGNGPAATLLRDSAGNLYGTTVSGGTNNDGVVFKLIP